MSVNGFDEVEKALQEVSELDTRQAVGEAIQFVRSAAVENCHADTGELRQSIFAETTEEENSVTGICWTDKAYAPYIEFGTGPKGQEKHAGISPEVTPVYTQQPWWIHESQIDRRVAEKYRWPYMDTPDGRFYRCSGNPAYPFLYPAMKDNEEQILKVLGGSLASAYTAEREELIRRYAKKDENGEIMTEDDCYIMEDKERFGKDMSELLNIETEVEIHTVSISVVEKCDEDPKYDSLTMAELDVIDFMLTE